MARIGYVSQGKLFVREADGTKRQVESPFGQEIVDRALRSQELDGWKSGDDESGPFGGSMLWGQSNDGGVNIVVTALTGGAETGELTYVIHTGTVGGLLRYDLAAEKERRLFHRANFYATDLTMRGDGGRMACSVHQPSGVINIAVMNGDGGDLRQVTEGDTMDESPAWVPGQEDQLVYHSTGIGRTAEGQFVMRGPAAIERLDLKAGTIDTLAEDEDTDFLAPQMDGAGNLYYIRRPYEGAPRTSPLKGLLDLVLFPFRLVRAIVAFLNVFSLFFSKKPLITAGRPNEQDPDEMTRFMLHGQMIEVDKVLKKQSLENAPSLVPKSWELVREDPQGNEDVLAKGVVTFDLVDDGLVYSNGTGVFKIDSSGKEERLFTDASILVVTALDG